MNRRDFMKLGVCGGIGWALEPSDLSYFWKEGIHLTIDDGPRDTTLEMVKQVEFYPQNKVTFYFVGSNLDCDKGKDIAKKVIEKGHRVGNHSFSHKNFRRLSLDDGIEEIEKTEEIIGEVYDGLGVERRGKYFRYPCGARTSGIDDYLDENGFVTQFWDVDSEDWRFYSHVKRLTNKEIKRNCMEAETGDIVLIHDLENTLRNILSPVFVYGRYKLTLN